MNTEAAELMISGLKIVHDAMKQKLDEEIAQHALTIDVLHQTRGERDAIFHLLSKLAARLRLRAHCECRKHSLPWPAMAKGEKEVTCADCALLAEYEEYVRAREKTVEGK